MYYGKQENPPNRLDIPEKEEKKLWTLCKKGDMKAKEKLTLKYLCFAFSVASKLKGPRLSHEEATAAANEGLMEAMSTYRWSKGKFIVHCYWPIRRHVIEALLATYPVKVGSHLRKKLRKQKFDGIEVDENDEPKSLPDIFSRLSQRSLLNENYSAIIYEQEQEQGGGNEDKLNIEEVVWNATPDYDGQSPAPTQEVEAKDVSLRVREFISSSALDKYERAALIGRHYQEPVPSFEILAKRLHVAKKKIRASYDSALVKLKIHFNGKN
jgi:RNA polymerase sigma factor (sigma-70 family)